MKKEIVKHIKELAEIEDKSNAAQFAQEYHEINLHNSKTKSTQLPSHFAKRRI